MTSRITQDEWLSALAEMRGRSANGMSMREIEAAWRVCHQTAIVRMRTLFEMGRVEVGFRDGQSMDGRSIRIPVYRLKGRKPKRK